MSKSSIGKISSYQVNILVFIQTVDKTFGCEHGWMWKFICLVPVPVQVLAELKKTGFFKYWSSAALFNLVTIHRMHEVTRELNVVTDSYSEMNFYFFNFFDRSANRDRRQWIPQQLFSNFFSRFTAPLLGISFKITYIFVTLLMDNLLPRIKGLVGPRLRYIAECAEQKNLLASYCIS